ncbi:MAG TPA: alpha-amylase family glycosyl hydrolase [Panacibacter sp.]|nr:alpha-amylase family glycosyl hydrolase [Panacibacter sp.]HNP43388.1 alpha-amylase family glycosyl hydrolase [Panacibacter sp.]
MKKLLMIPFLLVAIFANSQLLTWTPDFIQESSTPVTITTDAYYGNQGLFNYGNINDVYVHIGVITNKSNGGWAHVNGTWGKTGDSIKCVWVSANKWKFTITGGLRPFFKMTDASEKIQKIAILFRNGDGSKKQANKDNGDMYVPVYDNGVYARIDVPYKQPTFTPIPEPLTKNLGDALSITAKSSQAGSLKIYFNGGLLTTSATTTATANSTIAVSGDQQIIAESTVGSTISRDTIKFVVASTPIADLPPGVKDGINYEAGDTSAVLVLYAPSKNNIFVLGDFNNWTQTGSYIMSRTPDGLRYWIRLKGLAKGTEYAYQYLVDGSLKVADYNAEKILDPDNDPYISADVYPNLKAYPTGKTTGIVSVLQTAKPAYNWQVSNFVGTDKRNLIVYELLVRDFVSTHSWQTVKDTLSYLKRLGVNAIEVMPFNEFEGNSSWGYNPSFYFAPDKYYGTETALRQFIDECHKNGIAVIMDIVLNHTYGQSPLAQLYWDAANNRPAANNPWYNAVAPTAFGFGNDFNHESTATKDFFNRVLTHWITNYKIDGYRFDFSKGLTQKHSTDDASFSAYDASRIAIIKGYAATIRAAKANAYIILEHFCANAEEKELSDDNGMMVWANLNYNFMQGTMGYNDGADWNYGIYSSGGRGWAQANLVDYMESHDEERVQYKNGQYGNSSGSYNVKTLSTGLSRDGMSAAFLSMIPGPKMLWEFGELGYDYSRCYLSSNGEGGDCNTKLDPKPIKWDYYQVPDRKALYDVYTKLFALKKEPAYLSTFTSGAVTYSLSTTAKWMIVQDNALKVVVMGNYDVVAKPITVTFPATGTWYSYLTGTFINLSNAAYTVTLQPGEYYVYTNKQVVLPVNLLSFTGEKTGKNTVLLNWSTSNEVNNQAFEVQRSANGSAFETIGTVPASTITAPVKKYQFTDAQPFNGDNYYRLRQLDKDGQVHISNVIKVVVDAGKYWQVYPNPVSSSTAIHISKNVTNLQITITDFAGRIVYRNSYNNASAGQTVSLPLQKMPKGTYILQLSSDKSNSTEKLLVQ